MKFNLTDYIKSSTATRLGIDNSPDEKIESNLRNLHRNVTRFIYQYVAEPKGKHITITSGYRSPQLNKAIGSKPTSQHTRGQAVDLEIIGISNRKLWEYLKKELPSYDQLILEFFRKGEPQSGWVHISYVDKKSNRMQAFTIG